jgi:signal transduction histidine kinase
LNMPRLINSLQFRLTVGFTVVLALTIAGVSAYSAFATRKATIEYAEQVEAVKTERAELLVQNAYQANQDWAEVQLAVAQVGGLFGWRVVVTDINGYVVADSHEIVMPAVYGAEHLDDSRVLQKTAVRRPILIGNRVVGEMFMQTDDDHDRPSLALSDYGADLFERLGISVPNGSNVLTEDEFERLMRSSRGGRIPATQVAGSNDQVSQTAQDTIADIDSLLPEPPLSDLEASFRHSLFVAGIASIFAGLVFVTFFTRQALSPVRMLTSGARRLGAGDLAYRVPENRKDEIGELASTFNEMASDLESAEAQRRRMTADIAHELRTPLTNIQGYLEAILDGVVEADQETISSLHLQTVHLARLVDDLRLLSVAEAGALRLETSPDSLGAVILETTTAFQPRSTELGIALHVDVKDDLPPVELDRTRMRQVIANLVENALQHTPRGGSVSVSANGVDHEHVEFTVADTGHGIPADQIDRIFDQFYRVDPSRNRATGGAGLGLTIAKRLVEAHGGELTVTSTQGVGTTFRVELPVAAEAPSSQ